MHTVEQAIRTSKVEIPQWKCNFVLNTTQASQGQKAAPWQRVVSSIEHDGQWNQETKCYLDQAYVGVVAIDIVVKYRFQTRKTSAEEGK